MEIGVPIATTEAVGIRETLSGPCADRAGRCESTGRSRNLSCANTGDALIIAASAASILQWWNVERIGELLGSGWRRRNAPTPDLLNHSRPPRHLHGDCGDPNDLDAS